MDVRTWRLLTGAGPSGLLLAGLGAAIAAPASPASAQGAAGCPAPASRPGTSRPAVPTDTSAARAGDTTARSPVGPADIILFAAIEARSLRFNSQPSAQVRFCWGDGGGDTLRVIERRNLPSPVVAGVTYRDVYVAVELRGHLNPECLMRGRATSDTTGPVVPPSLLAACASMLLRPAVQPDSQPRPPPR